MARSTMHFRTFRSYAQHLAAAKSKVLGSIEQNGVAPALERCRELAEEICEKLQTKKASRLDTRALAEFQVALERAASVRFYVPEPTHQKQTKQDSN
jgi:hypothetical protein